MRTFERNKKTAGVSEECPPHDAGDSDGMAGIRCELQKQIFL